MEVPCRSPEASIADLILPAAWADALAEGELLVLQGKATLRTGDRTLEVGAGQLVRVQGGNPLPSVILEGQALSSRIAWRDGNAPWQELWAGALAGWTASGTGALGVLEGRLRLCAEGKLSERIERDLPKSPRFLWTVRFRGPGRGGYLDIALPAGSWGRSMTLGELPQLGDGKEHALTLRWDMAPALLLDGAVVKEFSCSDPGDVQAGLGVTHGTLSLGSWQWRPLP